MRYLLICYCFLFLTILNGQELYRIPLGSKNNILELSLANNSPIDFKQINYKIIEISMCLRVSDWQNEIGEIKKGENKDIEIKFDIADKTDINEEGGIRLGIYNGETLIAEREFRIRISHPLKYELKQNYPNPFNPTTTICYTIPQKSMVSLKIFNILGEEVSVLIDEEKEAGEHKIIFSAEGIASGIYYYKIKSGDYSETKKLIIVK